MKVLQHTLKSLGRSCSTRYVTPFTAYSEVNGRQCKASEVATVKSFDTVILDFGYIFTGYSFIE